MPILFLDCDGTIREPSSGDKFINHPNDQRIIEGAREAIEYYSQKGWDIIGITNQGGVAAGHKPLSAAIEEQHVTLSLVPQLKAIFFCPDFEGNTCWMINRAMEEVEWNSKDDPLRETYRKPRDGMIWQALCEFDPYGKTNIKDHWYIGDREEDDLCAAAAGINFMWADVWRDRFKKGFSGVNLSSRHFDKQILLKFLAT